MYIKINKVILHNFLSYGHSEIDLNNKHYCLVSGINYYAKDNATSNGSGKSSWGSAICWAITGETIQGVSSGIKNKNVSEDSCYVTLDFLVDDNHYVITRYKNPKSDLNIILNDKDISGKGIRESEAILSKYLPDLTSQLIASIIILGQGLPCKFTSNTPSGRKDVLEKLSKSDFMIQDLKIRITERTKILNDNLRVFEDNILSKDSNKTLLFNQLTEQESLFEKLNQPHNFTKDIEKLNEQILALSTDIKNIIEQINNSNTEINEKNDILESFNIKKNNNLKEENDDFNAMQSTYFEQLSVINSNIKTLTDNINKIKNIRDVCPTCGQHIPNVEKPSTEREEIELSELYKNRDTLNTKFNSFKVIHAETLQEIEKTYLENCKDILTELKNLKQNSSMLTLSLQAKESVLLNLKNDLNKTELEEKTYKEKLLESSNNINNLKTSIKKLDDEILYNITEKDLLSKHISVVNQMNTLIKRDFRGYLLSNVIDYLSGKVKEYSLDIFGTDELTFTLSGNNIEICYLGKPFENLSGGEKQRVDLSIQFAIRDMMKQYLGFSSNILILDEIFDALDATAVDAVLNCLCNKLTDVESIFIISHRAQELEIPYDSELIVSKDVNGISTVKWQ